MIGFDIKSARGVFFDAPAVMDATTRAERRVLSRFGAFVRRRARSSIRKAGPRTRSSQPGRPPKSHTGLLRRHILFGYDRDRHSVTIGPARLAGRISSTALEALEYGGQSIVGGRRRHRRVNVKARPFMGPAFEKELETSMPDMWKDSIR